MVPDEPVADRSTPEKPAGAKPAAPKKASKGETPVDSLIRFADSIPFFKSLRRGAAGRISPENRRPIFAVAAVLAILTALAYNMHEKIFHGFQEAYGPDVVIGVTDPDKLVEFGQRSLLYEFVFYSTKLASPVTTDDEIVDLFVYVPDVVVKPECAISLNERKYQIARVVLVAQNSGHKTAKDYQMIVTFSSNDLEAPDPGVRILGHSTDALRATYVYQQEPKKTIAAALARCPSLRKFHAELTAEESGGNTPEKISQLMRETYRSLWLTRDLIILNGTLEAHLFQLTTLVVAVPEEVSAFATVFHVECGNCSFFYKTNSYAQLVGMGESAQQPPARAH